MQQLHDPSPHARPLSSPPAIERLSDDLLYAIFELLRSWICFPGEADVPYRPLSGHTRIPPPSECEDVPLWTIPIVLSHVCVRWRAFTFASPRLWSFVRVTGSFPNRIMMHHFIERSQDCPLSVLLTMPKPKRKGEETIIFVYDLLAVTSEVGDHAERIQELGVLLPSRSSNLILEDLAHSPLSNLQKLWLDAGENLSVGDKPVSLLSVNPSSMRIFHANGISVDWLAFEGLVRLELSWGSPPTLPELLYTLRKSPCLEVLKLHIPCSYTDDSVTDQGPPVHLPHLRKLRLTTNAHGDGAFAVLPHITYSSTTDVELHSRARLPPDLRENESLARIAAAVERADLYLEPRNRVLVKSDLPSIAITYPAIFRGEHYQWADPGTHLDPRLCEAFLAVPFPALTTLSIFASRLDPFRGASIEQFNLLFAVVSTITHLRLDIDPAYLPVITAALSKFEDEVDEARSVRCPNLRCWTVVWSREPSVDDFWLIERCCARRAAAGVPLEQLETTAVPELVLANLQLAVGHISVLHE